MLTVTVIIWILVQPVSSEGGREQAFRIGVVGEGSLEESSQELHFGEAEETGRGKSWGERSIWKDLGWEVHYAGETVSRWLSEHWFASEFSVHILLCGRHFGERQSMVLLIVTSSVSLGKSGIWFWTLIGVWEKQELIENLSLHSKCKLLALCLACNYLQYDSKCCVIYSLSITVGTLYLPPLRQKLGVRWWKRCHSPSPRRVCRLMETMDNSAITMMGWGLGTSELPW